MLRVVRELPIATRSTARLAGLALRLSARGYAQLPGADWGMDDGTIARFQRDAALQVPGDGPNRFAARAAFLNSDEHRARWLQWRADQLHQFYRRVQQTLAAAHSGATLCLAGAEMFSGAEIEAELRPVLPPRNTLVESLLCAGIDLRQYQDDRTIVLLRPERIAPHERLGAQAIDLEINQMPDVDEGFRNLPCPGSLFFHCPQEARVASPDQQGPLKSASTWLLTQAAPFGGGEPAAIRPQPRGDGFANPPRRRLDAHPGPGRGNARRGGDLSPVAGPAVFRGGGSAGRPVLAAGDVSLCRLPRPHVHVRRQRRAVFGHRPGAGRCAAGLPTPGPGQPRLGGTLRPDGDGFRWQVELGPYELAAATLSDPDAKLHHPQASIPGAIAASLAAKIRQLGARAAALRTPPALWPWTIPVSSGLPRPRNPCPAGPSPAGPASPCNSTRRRNTPAGAPCGSRAAGRSPASSAAGSSRPPRDGFRCPFGSASPTPPANPRSAWRWKESSTDATIIASPPSANRRPPESRLRPSPASGGNTSSRSTIYRWKGFLRCTSVST